MQQKMGLYNYEKRKLAIKEGEKHKEMIMLFVLDIIVGLF